MPRDVSEATFLEVCVMSLSSHLKRGYEASFLFIATPLEVVELVFFLRKINDFKGSPIIVSLMVAPSSLAPMKPQNQCKTSLKALPRGCTIMLLSISLSSWLPMSIFAPK